MEATAETTVQPKQYPPRDPNKPRQKRINYALAATLLASGATFDAIAAQVGASNGESLRAGLSRKGVTKRSIRNVPIAPDRVQTITAKIATEASEILRDGLNGNLSHAITALNNKRLSYKSLASRGQGHAATLKQLAETWRTLNGNPDSVTISFGATNLSDAVPVKPESLPVVDCVSEQNVNQPENHKPT